MATGSSKAIVAGSKRLMARKTLSAVALVVATLLIVGKLTSQTFVGRGLVRQCNPRDVSAKCDGSIAPIPLFKGDYAVSNCMMAYRDFVPRLYNFCKNELGMTPGKMLPSIGFDVDENQGYPATLILHHFGAWPFNHGYLGGILALDRHAPHARHGKDMVILHAPHVGYDPLSSTFGIYRRKQVAEGGFDSGPDSAQMSVCCGVIDGILSGYRAELSEALEKIMVRAEGDTVFVSISNTLIREDDGDNSGLFLEFDRMLVGGVSNPHKLQSTTKVFVASDSFAAAVKTAFHKAGTGEEAAALGGVGPKTATLVDEFGTRHEHLPAYDVGDNTFVFGAVVGRWFKMVSVDSSGNQLGCRRMSISLFDPANPLSVTRKWPSAVPSDNCTVTDVEIVDGGSGGGDLDFGFTHDGWTSLQKAPFRQLLTPDLFFFRRPVGSLEGEVNRLQRYLLPEMPKILYGPWKDSLIAAMTCTQAEFDRAMNSVNGAAAYKGKNVMLVSGCNIDVSPTAQEKQEFPSTLFLPWAAYIQLDDGRYRILEQPELVEALTAQRTDNEDAIDIERGIQQLFLPRNERALFFDKSAAVEKAATIV